MHKSRHLLIIMYWLGIIYSLAAQEVTQNGAFSYNYPIEIPPGTHGMQPHLALSYNSFVGNGFIGVGWYLTGLSSVTRDGTYPVNYDDSDHFLYNGNRLVYNAADGYYHTMSESYLRIKAFNLNTPDSYWIVTLKNGTKMYYGYRSNHHTTANDGHIDSIGENSKDMLWGLSMVEDICGNYYIVQYWEDANTGAYYPHKIIYTLNKDDSIAKYRIVAFSYEDRPDYYPVYIPNKNTCDKRFVQGNLDSPPKWALG